MSKKAKSADGDDASATLRSIRRWPPPLRRPNPVFGGDYEALRRALLRARRRSGLSQRQLAAAIGRAQSHIGLIERGQRRVDALEIYYLANAMGFSPLALFAEIILHLECGPGAVPDDDAPAASET